MIVLAQDDLWMLRELLLIQGFVKDLLVVLLWLKSSVRPSIKGLSSIQGWYCQSSKEWLFVVSFVVLHLDALSILDTILDTHAHSAVMSFVCSSYVNI